LSKKPFQKELALHRLTFDPGQRRVLLLVLYKMDFDGPIPIGFKLSILIPQISKLMGEYMLRGYRMLATTCPDCGTIELQDQQVGHF